MKNNTRDFLYTMRQLKKQIMKINTRREITDRKFSSGRNVLGKTVYTVPTNRQVKRR